MTRMRSRLFLTALESRLAPAVFTVTNANNSGSGSLRQAVLDANGAAGADLIDFSSYFNVPRTITLNTQISITGAVTIDGTSAANVIISGNSAVSILSTVAAPAGAAIGLVDITLTKGNAADSGGALIANDEALTFTRCGFTANVAASRGGAIYVGQEGTLTATDCVFTANASANAGGAIFVDGGVVTNTVLTRCAISSNSSFLGGGASIAGNLLVDGSTVSGNSAVGYWGYYGYYAGDGGGLSVNGAATVRNSTISGNGAAGSGAGIHSIATLSVLNSTIAGNVAGIGAGGGILASTVTIESSIVANNGAPAGPDISAATVNAKASSILSRNGITTFNDQGGNRPSGENPRLGLLQSNGGSTKTHLLLPGSPCLNTGSNSAGLTTDQRGAGFPRVLAGTADMGATEGADVVPLATLISLPPTIVAGGGATYDVVVQYEDDNAIDLATIDLSDITVTGPGYGAPQSPTTRSIVGSGALITVTYTVPAPGGAFDFADDGLYTVALVANQVGDADVPTAHFVAASPLGTFRVAIPGALVVDEATDVDDGNTITGHLSLREAIRLANTASGTTDSITFDPAVFGGPVTLKLVAGQLNITDPVVINGPGADKLTLDAAGASRHFTVHLPGTSDLVSLSGLTLMNGFVNGGEGGAIYSSDALTLSGVVINNCKVVAGQGGAVRVYGGGTLTSTDCIFTANLTSGYGGAIYVDGSGSKTVLTRCIVAGNQAHIGGGLMVDGSLLLDSSTVSGNTAVGFEAYYGYYPGYGGGIFIGNSGVANTMTVRNCTISGNKAGTGGGFEIRLFVGTLVVQNSTITANSAKFNGGGINSAYPSGATMALESCIVSKNTAAPGPEIYSSGVVNAKTSSIFNRAGITTYNDLGGNRPTGEDPLLGPLANNGGPTLTHALLPGSPVVQRGSNPTGMTNDQRGPGFTRTIGVKPDMGAVESLETPPAATVVSVPPTIGVAGGTSYAIAIQYEDETGIDLTTIDVNDITVTGPGYATPQAPTSLSVAGAGKAVTVTYTLPAPGGAFDGADNGVYAINLLANQVRDLDVPVAHFLGDDTFSAYRVAIPFALVVDEASDVDDGNVAKGHLSLREAVRLTNAVPGSGDTITFDPTVFAAPTTIQLTAGVISVTDPLRIFGPGVGLLTFDAAGKSQLFTMHPGAGNSVSLSGVTLINGVGNVGGAISASSALNLSGVVIGKSSASAYYEALGGAVYVNGALTATNCTFSGNWTSANTAFGSFANSSGGAIYVIGNLLLDACTVSGNTAHDAYGYSGYYPVFFPGVAGGIFASGTTTIRNSTISGNSASTGGGIAGGMLVVQNSTIANNSNSGIQGNEVSLESSIVAKNLGGDIGANIVNAKSSLVFNRTGITTFNDLGGNRPAGEDPRLGPLQNNGGPTATHGLLPGSPCYNTGSNPANLDFDQRGFARVVEGAPDMGAVEGVDVHPAVTLITVPATVTAPGGTSFAIVIRYEDHTGIDLATVDLSDITVTGPYLAAPLTPTARSIVGSGKVVTVTYTLPAPGGSFDITDNGLYTVAVAPNQVGDTDTPTQHFALANPLGSFSVAIAGTVVVDEASDIDDGNATKGHLSLREAVRITNYSVGTSDSITFDPAVFAAPVSIKLIGGEFTITDPVAIVGPGASRLTLDAGGKSRLVNVDLPGTANMLSITGLTLTNGKANSNGGAIVTADKLTLTDVVVRNSQADAGNGGGISMTGSTLTLINCVISNNTAAFGGGGGVFVDSGTAVIARSTLANNHAYYAGGGLDITGNGFSLQFSDSTVANNSTANEGGAGIFIYGYNTTNSFIRNSTITGNTAGSGRPGGGINVTYYTGTLPIANCTITGNSTGGDGGGIAVIFGKISLNSTIVAGNSGDIGPDMYFNSSTKVTANNNLIGIANSGQFSLSGTGNKTGSNSSPLDAKLGPLAFNGGPTQTRAPLAGSPAIDNGNNAASLANDQRGTGFVRVFSGKADIGAFEVQPLAASRATVQINGGAPQRSNVTSLFVTFTNAAVLPTNPATAFQLKRQSDNAVVTLNAVQSGSLVTLTFTGGPVNAASLADGRYTLTILAAQVNGGNFDGNGDGTAGDNYVLTGTPANGLFRLFGDADGDNDVDTTDFGAFRSAFGGTSNIFDFDNDGDVDTSDFGAFRARFGSSI